MPIRLTFDAVADAAYLSLREIEPRGVAFTHPCDPIEVNGMIDLDLDRHGRLISIEVIDATTRLPAELLLDSDAPT